MSAVSALCVSRERCPREQQKQQLCGGGRSDTNMLTLCLRSILQEKLNPAFLYDKGKEASTSQQGQASNKRARSASPPIPVAPQQEQSKQLSKEALIASFKELLDEGDAGVLL